MLRVSFCQNVEGELQGSLRENVAHESGRQCLSDLPHRKESQLETTCARNLRVVCGFNSISTLFLWVKTC